MEIHYSPSNGQSHLNLAQYQSLCAENLTTTDTSHLIRLLTRQKIAPNDVLELVKEGRFTIPYLHGNLIFTLSRRGKQGQPYLLNVAFSPISYTSV